MKILQLNNRVPWPLNDGGNIGVFYFTEGYLRAGLSVSLLAMNTVRHPVDLQTLPPVFKQLAHFETVMVDNSVKPWPALRCLLSGKSYNIYRFVSDAYKEKLIQLLKDNDFDIVQLEGLYLTPYIPVIRAYSKAKVVIRLHNVEFRIWERLWQKQAPGLKKWYLHRLFRQLRDFEIRHLNDYDLALPISVPDEKDYRSLGAVIPMYLFPFGVEVPAKAERCAPTQPLSIYHLGAMDWLPNREGIDWFLKEVWPLVCQQVPEAHLYLGGRNMPAHYREMQLGGNVHIAGEVADAAAFEKDKGIMIVPLLAGGGVRIKIFNGMALGKAIVTTSVGVEGIEARDGESVMIADTPALFAEKLIHLLQNPALAEHLGTCARTLIEERYNSRKLFQELVRQLETFIHGNNH